MYEYDPGLVTVIIGGKTMVGYASGTFVRVSRNNPTWKHEKGAQGTGVRTRSHDRSGVIELTLQSTSPSNGDLREFVRADEDPTARPETVGALVKYGGPDDDGHVIWSGKDAWVEMPAASEFSDDHTPRPWRVIVDELIYAND